MISEELHDCGLIEPRPRRDRAAIVDPSSWNRSHDRQMVYVENCEHDRRLIVAQSWRDRGPIVAKIVAIRKRN